MLGVRGVAGGLWGIVSIAHSLKSDDVEGVGDMGMYMERGEAGSVRQAGRGGSRSVAQHGGAQLYRCFSLSLTNVSRRFAAPWAAEHAPKWAAE